MVGNALKQAFTGTVLCCVLAGLIGCTSLPPPPEPAPQPTKHRKVVRATLPAKVVKHKKLIVKKVAEPAVEVTEKPPVIPALGGGNGGSGGSAGGSSW